MCEDASTGAQRGGVGTGAGGAGAQGGSGGGAREQVVRVLEAYGEDLEAARKLEDAAVAYMSAGRWDRALVAYK